MATKMITSFKVAIEDTYGDIDSSTGLPNDPATNTYYTAVVSDQSQLVMPGELALTDVNTQSKCGFYELAPEFNSILDGSGSPIKRRSGKVTLTMPVQGLGDGTNFATWNTLPLWNIANTGMSGSQNGTVASDDVATAGSTTSHTVTTIGRFTVGECIKAIVNGSVEYSYVTDIDGSVIKYSPAFSSALEVGTTVYPMTSLTIPSCDSIDNLLAGVRLLINGNGWQATCSGCLVDSIAFSMDPSTRELRVTYVIDCAYIAYENVATVPSKPTFPDGGVWHQVLAYGVVSSTGGTKESPVTAPAELARTAICVDEFNFTITFNRTSLGCGATILTRVSNEVTSITYDGSVIIGGTTTTFDSDMATGVRRNLLIGFNSGQPNTAGEGGCIFIPAAFLKADPEKRDTGKDALRTVYSFGVADYAGDDGTTGPANSCVRWSFGDTY